MVHSRAVCSSFDTGAKSTECLVEKTSIATGLTAEVCRGASPPLLSSIFVARVAAAPALSSQLNNSGGKGSVGSPATCRYPMF